jgi:hypothetical protein
LQKKTLRINYPSLARLLQDYSQIKSGNLFLRTQKPLPLGTALTLKITVPEVEHTFQADCTVAKLSGSLPDNPLKEYPGMLLTIEGGADAFITELNLVLNISEKHHRPSGSGRNEERPVDRSTLPDQPVKKPLPEAPQAKPENISNETSHLSMGWIKKALQREKVEVEDEHIEEKIKFSSTTDKKDLTPEERRKVEPVGEFVMDLTKAMLRSGYYSPDHPGSMQAKQGLYSRFQSILGDSNEILIANRESREKKDFFIMGILDEPISIKLLVGAGRAELFEPKLRDYFNRKSLVSFAIKKRISLEHFNRFIDIMCDPQTDDVEKHKVGELLTNQLVENGITDISSNFVEDKLFFKEKLPWRVEMAIQRLAKDLKVLPQFAKASDEKLRAMKIDIIKDILRPLKHPDLLKELIINCYVIVENVKHLDLEEIEQTLVNAFPIPFLHATSLSIFKDMEKYKEEVDKYLDDPDIAKRYNSMKRIIKLIATRMIQENTPRVQNFLEKLYFSKLLTYEELPSTVKYQIDTTMMIEDLKSNPQRYQNAIADANSPENGTVLIKWFHRVTPKLIENKDWNIILNLLLSADRADTEIAVFPRSRETSLNPFTTIFTDFNDELAAAYNSIDETQRRVIEAIVLKMGAAGINVFGKILSDSENPAVRKAAIASLGEKGETALQWVRSILDDPNIAWHLHRNALLILNKAKGNKENDTKRVIKYLEHKNSRVREEALRTLISIDPEQAEQFIIEAVDDENEKVRLRALHALSRLTSLSDTSLNKLLNVISSDVPDNKDAAASHSQKVTHLIGILTAIDLSDHGRPFEKALMDVIAKITEQQTWLSKIVKSSVNQNNVSILTVAVKALKKMGNAESILSLNEIIKGKSPYAKFIKDALDSKGKSKEAAARK